MASISERRRSPAAEAFRLNLRRIMDQRGLNIQQMADLLGTSRPNMSRILSGQDGVTLVRAERMASTLGIRLTDLVVAKKSCKPA